MTSSNLTNKLDDVFKKFSKSNMADYLDLTLDATNKWRTRWTIPFNKIKGVVEFLEMHNDDCVTMCQELMDYYNSVKQKRQTK